MDPWSRTIVKETVYVKGTVLVLEDHRLGVEINGKSKISIDKQGLTQVVKKII